MNLTTFILPFHDDPTADHNQQSHVPRVPLWASQTLIFGAPASRLCHGRVA